MAKRKERTLKELYNVTEMILEPKITPVLRGSCRMQGPVDETDHDVQTNTVSSPAEKGFNRHSLSQKVHIRENSGTCNVCFAPCSSCMHFNRDLMGSKFGESSDETCRENAASQYSNNDVLPPFKSRACDNLQHSASDTSNLLSINSSHDSFSENAESKATLRTSDICDASEDVEMLPKVSSGGTVSEDLLPSKLQRVSDQRTLPNKYEDPKGLEGHDDNISCVSGANGANILVGYHNGDVDRKNVSCSSASVSSLGPEVFGKAVCLQTASGSLDIHCDVEESHHNSRRQSRYIEESTQKVPSISLSTGLFPHKLDLLEIPSSKDMDAGTTSPKVQSPHSHSRSGKSLSCNPNVKDLEEDSCSHLQGDMPECSMENLNSSLTKEAASVIVCGQKSAAYNSADIFQNSKASLIGGSSEASMKIYSKLGAETDKYSGDWPAEAVKCSDQNEKVEKFNESFQLPDMQKPSLLSQPVDESDESDIVEHDVKVCDICGDAGREDLLAICSRCTDGAEHTYCMREMLDKVPEGDWLCEECKFEEEIENQKQGKLETVDGNENNQSCGQASTVNTDLLVRLDAKDSDVEGDRTNKVSSSTQVSGKRHADNIEIASAAKRQVLEQSMGSPKASSPSKIAVISRDCSFKNLDKGKVKPAYQISFGAHSVNDILETARSSTTGPRLQTPQGILLKSKSFSTSNPKPKVKLVDEVVPQKQKLAREPASFDMKEGFVRMIGKSMSFKSANSGRLNATEPKVKMLSPKFSHVPDMKGLKLAKERNSFERKNLSKLDRPLVCSTMASSTVSSPKVDQKLTSHGEIISLSSVSNNRDLKAVQSDGKVTTLSKPINHLARKGSEMPVTLGEVKRQSSCLPNVVGASSTNGMCSSSAEQKPNEVSPKDEPTSSSSWTAERPFSNANGILQDGLPQSRESTNQGEKTSESPVSCSRQSIAGGRSVSCQKGKEIGHAAPFCTVGSPRASAVDVSATRSSREVMNKGNNLKAAIEAAILKKPGIYKKNRHPDQSDELSTTSMDLNCEIASQDRLSTSSYLRNMISAEGTHEGQAILRNSTADSCKQTTTNNVKQFSAQSIEAVLTSKSGDTDSTIPSDGKPPMRDLPSHASAAMSVVLNMSAIPEHEHIWQGDFEVHRHGKLPDLCGGIQAHLSTCASPKVLEVVNKFPCNILVSEVPRLSTWPTRFQESGTKEDNIALYFFAKDLESYERNYKSLLETMMKNDLALKGNVNGVELLIFPSNQLPEKSQRWNMLFFLWGVFRGRRVNCLQHISDFPRKFCIPSLNVVPQDKDIPTAIMSLSENICSLGRIDKDLSVRDRSCDAVLASEAPASVELPFLSSSETINGDCHTNVSSLDQKCLDLEENLEQQDSRLDSQCLSRIPASSAQLCREMRCNRTLLKEHDDPYCKLDTELQPSGQATRINSGSNKGEKMPLHWDTSLDRQDTSSHSFKILPVGIQEVGAVGSIGEEKGLDRINSSRDQVKSERNLKEEEGFMDTEAALERDTLRGDLTMKELNSWQFNNRKRPHLDLTETVSQGSSTSTSQTMPWNDVNSMVVNGDSVSKKLKTGFSGMYGYNSSRNTNSLGDGFASRINDLGPSSPIKEKRCDGACDEAVIPKDSGTTERYFFPVDSRPVEDRQLGDNSMPWKKSESEDEDRLHDGVPNLELALGAETKPPKRGILPFFGGIVDEQNNQAKPPDKVTIKEEEEDVSASLSLSLSFPFADKERTVKPVSKTEQLLPERRHVNTSLLLFRGLSDN